MALSKVPETTYKSKDEGGTEKDEGGRQKAE